MRVVCVCGVSVDCSRVLTLFLLQWYEGEKCTQSVIEHSLMNPWWIMGVCMCVCEKGRCCGSTILNARQRYYSGALSLELFPPTKQLYVLPFITLVLLRFISHAPCPLGSCLMSFTSCKIDCEGLHQCLLQWSYHSVKTDFPPHFGIQVNRTFQLISALLLGVFGEGYEARPVLGLEYYWTAHLNTDLGSPWFILFTHYMIAMAIAITFSFQVPCFWSQCGSYSFH